MTGVPLPVQIPAALLIALEPHARARGMTVGRFLVALGAHYVATQPALEPAPEPAPRVKTLTVEYGQALAARVAEGATIAQLALEHHVHTQTMRVHLKHYRIVMPPRTAGGRAHHPGAPRVVFALPNAEYEARWVAYSRAGANSKHLAARFGCTPDQARGLSGRLGLPPAAKGPTPRAVLAAIAELDARYRVEVAA